ncbi:MAG: redoxin domain-containing protein [Gammaproteobacteria bacterium]|nr:redoxin domain-containing protein [Gammaproteobacteria bacterium]
MTSQKLLWGLLLTVVMAGAAASLVVKSWDDKNTGELAINPFMKGTLAEITTSKAGKPYVLAFWSYNCGICVREMEVWRQVKKEFPEFELVMVTTDSIENKPRISQVLEQEDMQRFENWAFSDPIPARIRNAVDPKWRGELPRIHFYDAKGAMTVHMGMAKKQDVLAWYTKQETERL